jgi:acetyltransferase-like isoleucine patch superfamily enzyme
MPNADPPVRGVTANVVRTVRNYGVLGLLRLFLDWIFTRLTFPQARIIRRPAYIRGTGKIRVGPGFTSGPGLRIDCFGDSAEVVIGSYVEVNDYVHIGARASVTIGDRVLIASSVFISDHNHGCYAGPAEQHSSPLTPPAERPYQRLPVQIEDDVWLGEHVCVLPGVRIGKGSIIGAASVVTSSVPPYTICVGAPARPIKRFDFQLNEWVALR